MYKISSLNIGTNWNKNADIQDTFICFPYSSQHVGGPSRNWVLNKLTKFTITAVMQTSACTRLGYNKAIMTYAKNIAKLAFLGNRKL